MAEVVIPLETPWDMAYQLFTDPTFLAIFFVAVPLVCYATRKLRMRMMGACKEGR